MVREPRALSRSKWWGRHVCGAGLGPGLGLVIVQLVFRHHPFGCLGLVGQLAVLCVGHLGGVLGIGLIVSYVVFLDESRIQCAFNLFFFILEHRL